jgi:CNT family concentrative nucleoside transporter
MGNIQTPTAYANTGAYFAFTVLPTIIFFSALSTLLYYLGVLQPVVKGLAWVMQRTMKTSGSETLSATANIFLGQTEAPLFVRPFIARATKSELMAIMTGGFSNIASGVLAAYVAMLSGFEPQIAGHLLAASIISAPASLAVAKLLLPESEESETSGKVQLHVENQDANVIDSAARGAIEGLQLALNVGAMLMVFIALVAMLNALLGWIGSLFVIADLSLQLLLGYVCAPLAWLLGIPWHECDKAGSLIGIKTVINEFVAYLELAGKMGADASYLSPRSFLITAYALCGFANFSSIAIQVGGIGSMAPERRADLSRLGLWAMFGGAIASCMTACVIGILL